MFGISLNEWLLIAVLALTVLGPERLSTLARTAGATYRRARVVWANVQADVAREFDMQALQQEVGELSTGMHGATVPVTEQIHGAADEVRASQAELSDVIREAAQTWRGAVVGVPAPDASMTVATEVSVDRLDGRRAEQAAFAEALRELAFAADGIQRSPVCPSDELGDAIADIRAVAMRLDAIGSTVQLAAEDR